MKGINPDQLEIALRCYFELPTKYSLTNWLIVKNDLKTIAEMRNFTRKMANIQDIAVFESYISGKTISQTATAHSFTVRECSQIVKKFTNLLIRDVFHDFKNGILSIKPYSPKLSTKTDNVRRYNEKAAKLNIKPLRLRKKSKTETVRQYQKTLTKFKNQSDQ